MRTVFLLLTTALCGQSQQHVTLREGLESAGVAVPSIQRAELDRPITSHAAAQARGRRALASYFADEISGNGLPDEFHLIVSGPSGARSTRMRASGPDGRSLGALTRVHFTANYVIIGGHWSPSAAPSLAVRWSDLKPTRFFRGWVLQTLRGDRVVYHANMIHFAPTHSARVRWIDLATGVDREIYPLNPPSALWGRRVAYMSKLYRDNAAHLGNHHADPTHFTLSVRQSGYNRVSDTLALLLDFSGPERNGLEYKDNLTLIAVIYRNVSRSSVGEEAPLAEILARHGDKTFEDLTDSR